MLELRDKSGDVIAGLLIENHRKVVEIGKAIDNDSRFIKLLISATGKAMTLPVLGNALKVRLEKIMADALTEALQKRGLDDIEVHYRQHRDS